MKTLLLVFLLSTVFVACSNSNVNADKSSYNKKAIKHQIDRAEKEYKELN